MVEDDVQLIYKVLSGDDEAFTALVRIGTPFNRETVIAVGSFWWSCGLGDAAAVGCEQSISRPVSETV